VIGDIYSFVAANKIGAERLLTFMDEYGVHELSALAHVVQARSERAMREAIRQLPNGVYHSEIANNPLGTPLRYPLKVIVEDDTITLDFTGAPKQLSQGGLNSTLNYGRTCSLSIEVHADTAGCYRAFKVKAPAGSILNCDRGQAVNLRTRTGWYLAPNVFRALSLAAANKVQAMTALPVAIAVYGRDATGRTYPDHIFLGAGQGASAGRDGHSALLYPTSASNTSIELVENRSPLIVLEKTFITDSGGPGKYRGGLGQRVSLRKIAPDGQVTLISNRDTRTVRRRLRTSSESRRARQRWRDQTRSRHRSARQSRNCLRHC
jgi:5-oxoprolinase (ATP-hydrolysing)